MPKPEVQFTGPRWSSAVLCTRRAVYDAQHTADPEAAPKREPTRKEKGWFFRGNAYADLAADQIADQERARGLEVIREHDVPWPAEDPIGTGHVDVWIPKPRKVVEVHTNVGADLEPHKALQAAGYAKNLDAREAVVLAIDPTKNQLEDDDAYRVFPINIDALAAEVERREDEVYTGVVYDQLPERTCKSPDDSLAFGCAFKKHCFADWQYDETPIEEAPNLVELAKKLHKQDQLIKSHEAAIALRKKERDELREQLQARLEPGREVAFQAPGVDLWVKRIHVKGRETISLAELRAAGILSDEELEAFVKVGEPSERWYVKNKQAEPEVRP